MLKFTKDQQQAIDQIGSVIVSASAGSGKTTVMIQRILRLLKEKINVSGLMVSTFTKASALDMQTKLKEKLGELATTDPTFATLVDSINEASIGTFHSLCSRFLRQYFYACSVDPDFVLMDEQESAIILSDSISKVIEDSHQNPTEDFLDLYNIMLQNRSDRALKEQIVKIYQYAKAQVDWKGWLQHAVDCHDNPHEVAKLYEQIVVSKIQALQDRLLNFHTNATKLGMDFSIYVAELQSLISGVDTQLSVLSQKKCNIDKDNFLHIEAYEEFKDLKKYISDSSSSLFAPLKDSKLSYNIAKELIRLVLQTCDEYDMAKQMIAKIDFSDIEHCMLKVLGNEQARLEMTNSISHLFVDEYQDINPLQDKILGILGEKAEVFVVGDVKQSIYGFRMCDPKFFVDKMSANSLLDNNMKLIKLNGNFRSRNQILDFVNAVFAPTMTLANGGSDYALDSMLTGKQENDVVDNTLKAVITKIVHVAKTERPENLPPYDIINHVNQIDKQAPKIDVIVRHISNLVINQGVELKDIAILTHSRDRFCFKLRDKLNELGLTTNLEQSKTVLDSVASSSLLQFLSLVDYSHNDIALATVLRSGFVGLDEIALSKIRLSYSQTYSFCECCELYYKDTQDEISVALKSLFDKLENYQSLKNSLTVAQLAHTIVAQHDFLLSLYNKNDSIESLYWFLQDIESHPYQHDLFRFLQSVFDNPPKARQVETNDCIKIITVHASKGLEYDYIIMPTIDSNFHKDYARDKFLLDNQLGLASKVFDLEEGETHTNAVFEYFKYKIANKSINEEMRLLYVALTRAKKQLLLVVDSSASEYKTGDNVSKWSDWIYPIVQKLGLYDNCFYEEDWQQFGIDNQKDDSKILDKELKTNVFGTPPDDLLQQVKQTISIIPSKSTMVSKSSVTRLLKTEDTEPVLYEDKVLDIGKLYHKVLQALDLSVSFEDAYASLQNVITEVELSSIKKELIRKAHKTLFDLSIGAKVFREKNFMLNATSLTVVDGTNQVLASQHYNTNLIQGIVDFMAIKSNGIIVVDYKYSVNKDNIQAYNRQLDLYCNAISKILSLPIISACLYDIQQSKLIKF
ncbi:MAG: UvrD-helicase domain-containing protein [Firmicutes bacterium]|nr:UvrD-helicase domain-containing protein [Bacillota bacterium]MCL1944950.1 UvrD-helicase domain-containing protein [Bacillota bacterium]MCL1954239.1 UvrD-helicase domain-containing protein [Bacillota bacterium]